MGATLLFPQPGDGRAPGGSGSARSAQTKGAAQGRRRTAPPLPSPSAVPLPRRGRRARFGAPDFETLLGADAWAALPAAVRARFGHAAERETRVYPGSMVVRANWAGRIVAQLCRVIGAPFALWTGDDVPVSVRVAPAPGGGLTWERTYRFPGRPAALVASRKLADTDGSLLELVDGGLGMRLKLSIEAGDLVFAEAGYVWNLGPWLIPLPRIVTPGRSTMIHRDLGAGRFQFLMTFTHPLAGELFFQSGVFEDPQGECVA